MRVGVNIGPALGGLDTQYKRNDFYPGVFQFGAELAAYGLRACACAFACACARARAMCVPVPVPCISAHAARICTHVSDVGVYASMYV